MRLLALTVLARRELAAPLFAGILVARLQESASLAEEIDSSRSAGRRYCRDERKTMPDSQIRE
jgi:hypothetical protein